jgi:hypothetical protein
MVLHEMDVYPDGFEIVAVVSMNPPTASSYFTMLIKNVS